MSQTESGAVDIKHIYSSQQAGMLEELFMNPSKFKYMVVLFSLNTMITIGD